MKSLVPSVSVAALVLPAHLVEPLELARWDVAEDDDGPPRPLTVPEDALQPTELARGVLQVLHMFVGLVPEVGVQAQQGETLSQFGLIKSSFKRQLKRQRGDDGVVSPPFSSKSCQI